MKERLKTIIPIGALVCVAVNWPVAGFGAPDHSEFITGSFSKGTEVTQKCLECHERQADDFMKTSHWTWSRDQEVDGKLVSRGKKNAINNFCISIAGNEPRCTSCHAGYGWRDANFDFTDKTKVDCLICHDSTGGYEKLSTGAGEANPKVNLLRVAQNVARPGRDNCGACHFYGGGADATKHGDIDSSLSYPSREVDVHMDVDSNDFQCTTCHETSHHDVPGNSMAVSPGGKNHFSCAKCHSEAPHKLARLNAHVARVACQTCHIPFYAKEQPTKMTWDWSTAAQSLPEETDQFGKPKFKKGKGSFSWAKNVVPSYAWYDGSAGAYLAGDKIDPSKTVRLTYPLASKSDSKAKIHPFKVFRGKQIYDSKNNILITPKLFGPGGFWADLDWDKAARLGMAESGLQYSGSYSFAETETYWSLSHMVAPKERSLKCSDCHGTNGRMNWITLGYATDPAGMAPMADGGNPKKGKALFKKSCKVCHDKGGQGGEITPVTKTMQQWDRFFQKDRHKKKPEIWDKFNDSDLKDIWQFLYDHAADSDQPDTCG